jgi:hydroxyethylthiazole kinase
MLKNLEITLNKLKTVRPLILNLTNYVTMDFMANAQLALSAAPIMTVCDDELEELVRIAGSININIGTLDEAFIKRCRKAADIAKQYKKPIVLDPVGVGSTKIRTQTAKLLLEYANIVRGNASEIMSLIASNGETFGVESTNTIVQAKGAARELANRYGITVVISGPVDFITDGKLEAEVPFGSPLMPLVTGMGCTLTAVIAAFKGVSNNSFASAELATTYFGLCGQLAGNNAKHPGAFRTDFIDALHSADFDAMREFYVSHIGEELL